MQRLVFEETTPHRVVGEVRIGDDGTVIATNDEVAAVMRDFDYVNLNGSPVTPADGEEYLKALLRQWGRGVRFSAYDPDNPGVAP